MNSLAMHGVATEVEMIEASRWARSLGFRRRCMMGTDLLSSLLSADLEQGRAKDEAVAAGAMAILDKIRRAMPGSDQPMTGESNEFGVVIKKGKIPEDLIAVTVRVDGTEQDGMMIVKRARGSV